ncbi:SRPBCC domain-containing protein [Kribbella sp. NPDC058693]|uniref:SRPBCC domain-containing protein n=1 Tax=Kribbella sp. NPDC058693 TaxID=3346602 RepID=UPI00364ABA96
MAQTTHVGPATRAPQLRYVRTLNCAADRLWNLITTPDLLSGWLGSTVLSDTQYGGFLVATGPRTQQTGIVTTCEPPHYFQAAFNDPPHHPTTVLVDVVPAQDGSHLILTQAGIHAGRVADYDTFWTAALDRLERAASDQVAVSRADDA